MDATGKQSMRRLLVFHPIIAPYRIDFFNRLYADFDARICLTQRNLHDQTFNYAVIEKQFIFQPEYLLGSIKFGKRRIVKGVIKQIKEFLPDTILVPEVGAISVLVTFYKLLTFKKFKIVSLIDDSFEMAVEGKQFSLSHKLGEKLLFPFFDNIICVEPRVSDYFQKKYKKGVYFPIIDDDKKQRLKYLSSLELCYQYIKKYDLMEKRILLFVGRLSSEKNIKSAIQAFAEANVKDSVFIIVGGGSQKETLKEIALQNNNVIIAGRYEHLELFAWYNIASVFILPSIKEPFGAVTNEALLAGCYSLISKLAGSQCLIEEGNNGMLIDPYDVNSMAKIIRKALLTRPKLTEIKLRDSLMQENFDVAISRVIHALTN